MNAKELVQTIDRSFRLSNGKGRECIVIGSMEWDQLKHQVMEEP